MQVAYNGVVFDLVLLTNWQRERVDTKDKTTFLWWHHIIDMELVYNREATDAQWFPDYSHTAGRHTDGKFSPMGTDKARVDVLDAVRVPKGGVVGVRPPKSSIPGGVPMTDMEIRERMSIPRKKLIIWMNSGPFPGVGEYGIILEQPWGNLECDAQHGPSCTYNGVTQINGNSMGSYALRFETWEAPIRYGESSQWSNRDPSTSVINAKGKLNSPFALGLGINSPALVSNRWSMASKPNPQTHLLTREIEGEAIFRMDILKMRRLSADELRYQFMHPIPMGFVRRPPEVYLNSAGNGVRYKIADDMQSTNFPGGAKYGLIDVNVVQYLDYSVPETAEIFGDTIRDPTFMENLKKSAMTAGVHAGITLGPPLAGAAAIAAGSAAAALPSVLPGYLAGRLINKLRGR